MGMATKRIAKLERDSDDIGLREEGAPLLRKRFTQKKVYWYLITLPWKAFDMWTNLRPEKLALAQTLAPTTPNML